MQHTNSAQYNNFSLKMDANFDDGFRCYENLSSLEQQKVMERIKGVDYTVFSNILNFGNARGSSITKHAEVLISKYVTHELGKPAEALIDLVAILKSNNFSDILNDIGGKKLYSGNEEWSTLKSLMKFFSIKRTSEKIYQVLAQRKTILQNLQEIKIEMEKQKISLLKDIEVYEQMRRAILEQVNEFELDYIALSLMVEDAQARNLHRAIERMQRRMHTIASVRISTVQTMFMLIAIIEGNEIICEKIDEIMNLIIPMWSWQYAIAIGAIKQQEALKLYKSTKGVTFQLLIGNAKMLRDNVIAVQKELCSAVVAIEDLSVVQDYIEDMVATVQVKTKESSAKMVESLQNMQ